MFQACSTCQTNHQCYNRGGCLQDNTRSFIETKAQKPLDTSTSLDVNSTLSTRGNSHGDFIQNGRVMQSLKDLIRTGPSYQQLTPYQREAVDMICHKLGRIVCGDPNFIDHWHDICGYSQLVENILTTGKSHPSLSTSTSQSTKE